MDDEEKRRELQKVREYARFASHTLDDLQTVIKNNFDALRSVCSITQIATTEQHVRDLVAELSALAQHTEERMDGDA